MSGFMKFLDNIDSDIVNETYVTDSVEEVEEVKPKPKKTIKKTTSKKKDSSVKLIEARMRNKLDDIGLNETAIGEVISYVLNDINKVNGVSESKSQPKQETVQESKKPTMMSHASSLLSGDSSTPQYNESVQHNAPKLNKQEQAYANVSETASSLL